MGTRSEWLFTKTEAIAKNGMVTADPLPAEAGVPSKIAMPRRARNGSMMCIEP